jgi:hypothetical protein
VDDPSTRRTLAQAALDNKWRTDAMKNAVLAVRAGRWIDGNPDEPGLQPPDPKADAAAATGATPTGKPLAAGRVVSRVEKAASEGDALLAEWAQLDQKKLTKLQKARALEAATRMAQRWAELTAKLSS